MIKVTFFLILAILLYGSLSLIVFGKLSVQPNRRTVTCIERIGTGIISIFFCGIYALQIFQYGIFKASMFFIAVSTVWLFRGIIDRKNRSAILYKNSFMLAGYFLVLFLVFEFLFYH